MAGFGVANPYNVPGNEPQNPTRPQNSPYDAQFVSSGNWYQDFVNSIPALTSGFNSVYGTVSQPGPAQANQQPAQVQAPAAAPKLDPLLLYGGLGLLAVGGVIVAIKAR